MLLVYPLALWFGILTLISLAITMYYGHSADSGKPVLYNHKTFVGITAVLALIHITLAILMTFFGIVI